MFQAHDQEMVPFESVVEHLSTVNTFNLARRHLMGTIRILERETSRNKIFVPRRSRVCENNFHDIQRALFPACQIGGVSNLIEMKRYSENLRLE